MYNRDSKAFILIGVRALLILLTLLISLCLAEARNVQSSDFHRLDNILTEYPLNHSIPYMVSLEDIFAARTFAHRTRNVQTFLRLLSDPQFLKRLPEYKLLADSKDQVIEVMYEHDAGKGSETTLIARKILARAQGFNIYNLPAKMPQDLAKEAKAIIDSAIEDINAFDDQHMEKTIAKYQKGPLWEILFDRMMDAIDYYDTFRFRKQELANGADLLPPSKWLFKLASEGKADQNNQEDFAARLKLATFVENSKAVTDSKGYILSETYLKNRYEKGHSYELQFWSYRRRTLDRAYPISCNKLGSI